MGNLKLNNSDDYESFKILLNEIEYPIAFKKYVKSLMSGGLSEENAKEYAKTTEIELELYYEKNAGLMAVESEAVESGTIYSPYSGELYEED